MLINADDIGNYIFSRTKYYSIHCWRWAHIIRDGTG